MKEEIGQKYIKAEAGHFQIKNTQKIKQTQKIQI